MVAAAALLACGEVREMRRGIEIAAERRSVEAPDGAVLVTYRLFDREYRGPPRGTFFYVQGSSCEPILERTEFLAGAAAGGFDVVVAERRGIDEDGEVDRELCRRHSARGDRVADHLAVMRSHLERQGADGLPVVLLGGSEGGDVAAALAREEPRTTHLVLLGTGGGWPAERELRHFIDQRGEYLGLTSQGELDAVLERIRAAPDALEEWAGHPFRRWSSYLWHPAGDDLVALEIPIFAGHGTLDASVPVESARALADRFRAAGKTNLTYREYPRADHTFYDPEAERSLVPRVELDLVLWLAEQGAVPAADAERLERRVRQNHPELFGRGGDR